MKKVLAMTDEFNENHSNNIYIDKIIEKDKRFDLIFNSNFSRPRILYIVEAMGGGVFTYIVDLANSLVDDFDIYIAYGLRMQTPKDYKDYFDPRIQLIKINNFTREINIYKDIKAFLEIKRVADTVKPNVVHLHSSKAGVIGRIMFCFSNIPVFYTPHGYSFMMSGASTFKCFLYKCIEKICANFNSTTVSCSFGENLETLKLTKKAVNIDNGINIDEFRKIIDEKKLLSVRNETGKTVFTLGRINTQKNPEVFNLIAQMLPDYKFIWIGDGPLKKLLTAPNIEVTGWKERNEALAISLKCDIFILTSLWEGLPISLIEAMYLKKPVIVSNVIGNNDVVINHVNGYVCDKVEDYVAAIRDASHHEKYTAKAYEEVVAHYNVQKMKEQYKALYYEALYCDQKVFNEKLNQYYALEKLSYAE